MCGQREPLLYVNDMVEAAERIIAVCGGVDAADVLTDVDRSDIILWRLSVLGEAAKGMPEAAREAHPEIAWRDAARLRDRIVHHYEGVDPVEISAVVTSDLPRLLAGLKPLQATLLEEWRTRQEREPGPEDW